MSNLMVDDANPNKNKPSSSAFKQQKLPAWQPILTAGTVLPTFFLIGIAFVPIGIGLLFSSGQVDEVVEDYTYCNAIGRVNETCAQLVGANSSEPCFCQVEIVLKKNFTRDVFVYYGLTNYYQNHRRYVKSRDDRQLLGFKERLSRDCDPYGYKDVAGKQMPIAPCGAIANSLFNDTFELHILDKGKPREIKLLRTGISWATDKYSKFKNPPGENLTQAFMEYTNPPYWGNRTVYQLDPSNKENNGYLNEHLIVWMRTAALPSFRKLYGRIDHSSDSIVKLNLPAGRYMLNISYNYPVASFKGTKSVIISNTSWLGGKNPFLGVAYVVVGCICLILSGVFLFIHKKFGKSTADLINVTQRMPYLNS